MRLPTNAAKRFGWDWWAWNMVLAATPATVLWYGLSRTREGMKGEVGQLKAAIAEQKEHMHRQDQQQQGGSDGRGRVSMAPAAVVAGGVEGGTPEERIARLESRLAALEGHLSGRGREGGGGGSSSSSGSSSGVGEELLSGVKRRMLGQFEEGVLEAFIRLRGSGSAAPTPAAATAAAAEEESEKIAAAKEQSRGERVNK
jgi:hypothetical protein